MKQMVYVVLLDETVVGVYDEYTTAEKVALRYPESTITPVIVGQTDDCRVPCDNPSEVVEAMEYELQNIGQEESGDDDDDDDEDDYDEGDDDEEDEEEEEPIDLAVMTLREFLYHAVTGE